MLEAFDRTLKKVAVLENAYDTVVEERLNGVGRITFRLPGDDRKAGLCAPFGFVRPQGGDAYRLLVDGETVSEAGERQFEAEHAIATLVDDVMFGAHQIGGKGIATRQVLAYILQRQTVKRWQLGTCDFSKQFEYGFESENLLNALFSVPNLFTEPYQWVYDMRTYPWTVSLKRLNAEGKPSFYIRAGRNLIASSATRSGAEVCTRLYLLGYGEGDNQLTISGINGGVPYLQSPKAVTDQYGIISKVYVDRSFEDAASLKERGQALLSEMQQPRYRRSFEAVDLSKLTGQAIDRAEVGDIARLSEDGTRVFVTGVKRRLDVDGDMSIEISTTPSDLAASLADLADRQRIEQVYAQGATQIYAQSMQTNATQTTQAVMRFYIPEEMRIVNRVVARISVERFRSYNRLTQSAGRSTQTSSAGGGRTVTATSVAARTVTTTSAGGATRTTTTAGSATLSAGQTTTSGANTETTGGASAGISSGPGSGYQTQTGGASGSTGSASAIATGSASGGYTGPGTGSTGSASSMFTGSASGAGGVHQHTMLHTHGLNAHTHSTPGHTHSMLHTHGLNMHTHSLGDHRHSIAHTHRMAHQHQVAGHSHTIGGHGHSVTIPAHTHTATIPSHNHTATLPSHTHTVAIPAHTHEITQGIFRFGNPTAAGVYIGSKLCFSMGTEIEVDLTEYLTGSNGKIPRGSWLRLGVSPNDLAYVMIDLVIQGFVQSRGGGNH